MTGPWVAALLGGILLLAGCGSVEIQPQTEPATVTPPPEPVAEAVGWQQEQGPPPVTALEPVEAGTQPVQAEEGRTATADSAAMVSDAVDGAVQTETITHTGDATQIQAKPAEPNDLRPAEPNMIASAPAEPNDTAARVFKEYAEILKTYVQEDGRVDYGALRRRRLDLKPLLMKLGDLDPNVYAKWSRDEKLAFWINAYNLKMLDIITRNYPIQSSWWLRLTWPPDDIRHIRGIWTDFKLVVMDEEFTLSEVEHRLFQRTFDDPRVYLALTYASQSSPILRRQPYQGDNLDPVLDEQVRQFLSSPQGLQIDRRGRVVRLSALFKPAWRGKEFVARFGTDKKFKSQDPETRAVLNFLTGYLPREDGYFLEVENYAIEYRNFDWRLNDASRGY